MSSHLSFEATGTNWNIDLFDDISPEKLKDIEGKVKQRLNDFEKNYSRFRADSLVTEMATKAGKYQLPDDAQPLFDLYKQLYDLTKGAFTPMIGSVLNQAGYDKDYSFKPKKIEQPLAWNDVLDYHFPTLITKKPVQLDFGAAGKGYAIDLVAKMLQAFTLQAFCIDAGGDIWYENKNNKPLDVGLEHPADPTKVIGIANILNQSICGSAGNRRKWQNFHHIINPHTLSSPDEIIAVWTITNSALLADALATCLFFVSPIALAQYRFEYLIVYADYSIERSEHFGAELF